MANPLGFLARRALLGAADRLVTSPLTRWAWTGPAAEDYPSLLSEYRPTDRESVLEMMQGRYLLASKLVDTNGVSPFAVEDTAHPDWVTELEAFTWLRHFRDARSGEERAFARALALDWIGRHGGFDRATWVPTLCARRVLNWLRHYNLLIEGANEDEAGQIGRSIGSQIQSLRVRGALASDPVDRLMAALALAGVALCAEKRESEIVAQLQRVHALLDEQIDDDGLHKTRSATVQLLVMEELVTVRQALSRSYERYAADFANLLESMHRALDAISLGTGEAAYFNGTGQMPHDLMVAVQAQSPARARSTGVAGGYGRLIAGRSIVVADSGQVPEPQYAARMHASALAFEFSHGRDLVVCNCGPSPTGEEEDALLFRQGIAHSGPTINAVSAAAIPLRGPLAGRVVQVGRDAEIISDEADQSVAMRCHGYEDRFGIVLERRLTLLAEGKSLVGQDKIIKVRGRSSGVCAYRFHLGHQTEVIHGRDVIKLQLSSGQMWNFLWEGAEVRIEDSVRQSAYFGFHRTRQIVLETHVADAGEVSWIFTMDDA
ncbi:MAG TPA: heparinase II/III family protein [Devosia sp.]|nr:heparinase II/III family protein [Devosia sp.]